MNIKQLEAFVGVAREGSFSKAAKTLYLTQPTVSAHVSSLEGELKTRLFVRNTKEVKMSEDGKKLFRYAVEILDIEQKIKAEFTKDGREASHKVSVAASSIPSQYLLPDVMAKFRLNFPDEKITIVETDSAGVVEMVKNREVDLGFTGTAIDKKHCSYIPFYKDELVIVAPNTEHFQKRIKAEYPETWLINEPFIFREVGSGTRTETEKRLKKLGVEIDNLEIVATMGNTEAIKKSVLGGMGISIMSRLAAREEISTGKMLAFPLYSRGNGRDLSVVFDKNGHLSPSAEKMLKVVKKMYLKADQ